jgi:hypothetical protein
MPDVRTVLVVEPAAVLREHLAQAFLNECETIRQMYCMDIRPQLPVHEAGALELLAAQRFHDIIIDVNTVEEQWIVKAARQLACERLYALSDHQPQSALAGRKCIWIEKHSFERIPYLLIIPHC